MQKYAGRHSTDHHLDRDDGFKRHTAERRAMATFYDVPAEALIEEVASRLAERIEEPDWAQYVKSGANRELPPEQDNFWTIRAASILRRIAIDGPVGIERLKTVYGGPAAGSTRYRVAPKRHKPGSGNIIRTIIQQLEEAGLVEEQGSAGRIVTAEGRQLLDTAAGEVLTALADDRPELQRYV